MNRLLVSQSFESVARVDLMLCCCMWPVSVCTCTVSLLGGNFSWL